MMALAVAMILLGVWGLGWGVYTSFQAQRAKAWLGALVAPLSLVAALAGATLLFVPTFFSTFSSGTQPRP